MWGRSWTVSRYARTRLGRDGQGWAMGIQGHAACKFSGALCPHSPDCAAAIPVDCCTGCGSAASVHRLLATCSPHRADCKTISLCVHNVRTMQHRSQLLPQIRQRVVDYEGLLLADLPTNHSSPPSVRCASPLKRCLPSWCVAAPPPFPPLLPGHLAQRRAAYLHFGDAHPDRQHAHSVAAGCLCGRARSAPVERSH